MSRLADSPWPMKTGRLKGLQKCASGGRKIGWFKYEGDNGVSSLIETSRFRGKGCLSVLYFAEHFDLVRRDKKGRSYQVFLT